MTREEAKVLLPIIQAFAEGKVIECRIKPSALSKSRQDMNEWTEMKKIEFWNNTEYRIKPEPKYRPFKDTEECWEEMLKHQPFGWIKSKEDGSRSLITLIISEENIDINCIGGFNSDKIMEMFTFADGAVFGILEEEQLMYRPIKMYQIVCDRCGEVFVGTDTCSALFGNKEVDIGDYSDLEMIDGKHYYPDCYDVEVIDGVYNVKVKEK